MSLEDLKAQFDARWAQAAFSTWEEADDACKIIVDTLALESGLASSSMLYEDLFMHGMERLLQCRLET